VVLSRGEESFRDATLIEHLNGAGVETLGSRSVDMLRRAASVVLSFQLVKVGITRRI
jgi:hypothetical protein